MVTKTPAFEHYSNALELFRKMFKEGNVITLSSFCKVHSISYQGLCRWMKRQGVTVSSIKSHLCGEIIPASGYIESDDTFIPISLPSVASTIEYESEILSGISLTFSDGTILSIRKASAEAVMLLITKYRKEILLCLD